MLVLEKLRQHWWAELDEDGCEIPLTDVNQMNVIGEYPIHIAAWKGDPEDVLWLLENGANINQLGDFSMTPLHYAYMAKNHRVIEVLISSGANRFARCDRGLLPHESRSKGE